MEDGKFPIVGDKKKEKKSGSEREREGNNKVSAGAKHKNK